MYRRLTQKQKDAQARKIEAMRRGRERAAMARDPRGRAPELPHLRRLIEVTDFDSGEPVKHSMALFRTERVDTYMAHADGKPWKRCGWSAALAGLRKAFQRVPSPRSDLWW